jgi:hypothetical protein
MDFASLGLPPQVKPPAIYPEKKTSSTNHEISPYSLFFRLFWPFMDPDSDFKNGISEGDVFANLAS